MNMEMKYLCTIQHKKNCDAELVCFPFLSPAFLVVLQTNKLQSLKSGRRGRSEFHATWFWFLCRTVAVPLHDRRWKCNKKVF